MQRFLVGYQLQPECVDGGRVREEVGVISGWRRAGVSDFVSISVFRSWSIAILYYNNR